MLCDLCIIQLNVAYQFKTLAVELDAKHQQYLIENGVNLSPNSDNSTLHSVEQRTLERSSTSVRPLTFPVSLSNLQQRRLIKSEPTDYENMSDITIDTNTDLLEDFSRNGVNSSASNQPFGSSSMVCVSDLDLLRSNGDSDIEFINNCLPSSFRHFENPANTVESHQSTTTTTTTTIASKQLVIAASKSMNQNTTVTNQNTTVTTERHNKSTTATDKSNKLVTSELVVSLPRKTRKTKVKFAESELKKSLRPKSNESINYSVVRKKHKNINPMNKVRQKIKEENESIKQSSSKSSYNAIVNSDRALIPRNASILKNKRKRDFIDGKHSVPFRRGQHTADKGQYRESVNGRRIIIKDTDRFKFAAIKTIDSMTATR